MCHRTWWQEGQVTWSGETKAKTWEWIFDQMLTTAYQGLGKQAVVTTQFLARK